MFSDAANQKKLTVKAFSQMKPVLLDFGTSAADPMIDSHSLDFHAPLGALPSRPDPQVILPGLAYDHRFVNGRESAEFLDTLRVLLEKPGNSGV